MPYTARPPFWISGKILIISHMLSQHYSQPALEAIWAIVQYLCQLPRLPTGRFAIILKRYVGLQFMYLLYEVIQLRNWCLGNTLLIKWSRTSIAQDLGSLNVSRLQKATEELAANQVTTETLVLGTTSGDGLQGQEWQIVELRERARNSGLPTDDKNVFRPASRNEQMWSKLRQAGADYKHRDRGDSYFVKHLVSRSQVHRVLSPVSAFNVIEWQIH